LFFFLLFCCMFFPLSIFCFVCFILAFFLLCLVFVLLIEKWCFGFGMSCFD
jgi:hypothetical protein